MGAPLPQIREERRRGGGLGRGSLSGSVWKGPRRASLTADTDAKKTVPGEPCPPLGVARGALSLPVHRRTLTTWRLQSPVERPAAPPPRGAGSVGMFQHGRPPNPC